MDAKDWGFFLIACFILSCIAIAAVLIFPAVFGGFVAFLCGVFSIPFGLFLSERYK